jgi:uncharacterized RDD family membrane protein YckC
LAGVATEKIYGHIIVNPKKNLTRRFLVVSIMETIYKKPKTRNHWVKRGIALIIDIIVILGFFFLASIIIIIGIIFLGTQTSSDFNATGLAFMGASLLIIALFSLISIIFSALYFVILDVKFSGTVGKKVMGLSVVPVAVEDEMDYSKGVQRNLAKLGGILIGALLGSFIFVFGAIIGFVILDVILQTGELKDPRQKFTDTMAGTTVIRTDIEEILEDLVYIPPPPAPAPATTSAQDSPLDNTPEIGIQSDTDASFTSEASLAMKEYTEFFGITKDRALALYRAGYKQLKDFQDAIVEDLIMVEEINPTIARGILNKFSNEPT